MILPILQYSIRLLHDYYRLGNGSSGALVRSQTLVMHGRLGKTKSLKSHTHTLRLDAGSRMPMGLMMH